MRTSIATISFTLLAAGAGSIAAAQAGLPPGWSTKEDGAFVHAQSGATCPLTLGGLSRKDLRSAGEPDLGICFYADDKAHEGEVRVRQYVRGRGETPLAIRNDQMLMEPSPGSPKIVIGLRSGPGPERNGVRTSQSVLTKARGGLLIDCVEIQPADDQTKLDFASACMRILK